MPGETPPAVSEDCLYLNIWTPAKTAHEHLPVIVWIYGGGYINGSASMPLYWGDRLAHKGVIVVTIAYRLGPLGFLALSGADARVPAPLVRELRPDGPDRRTRMDSEEHCSLWRRPEKRNHRRSILRSDIGQHPDGLAPCERLVSARHRRERRSV